jgi:hypothetical protein
MRFFPQVAGWEGPLTRSDLKSSFQALYQWQVALYQWQVALLSEAYIVARCFQNYVNLLNACVSQRERT